MDMACCRTRTKRGNRDILTVMCLLTKFLIAVPMPNRTAADVAQAFLLHVLPFGVPKKLLSDRGNEWTTEAWTKVLALLEVKRAWTTPYYPHCNGAIERAHKNLNAALGMVQNPQARMGRRVSDGVLESQHGDAQRFGVFAFRTGL